jgi:hypothetical protein
MVCRRGMLGPITHAGVCRAEDGSADLQKRRNKETHVCISTGKPATPSSPTGRKTPVIDLTGDSEDTSTPQDSPVNNGEAPDGFDAAGSVRPPRPMDGPQASAPDPDSLPPAPASNDHPSPAAPHDEAYRLSPLVIVAIVLAALSVPAIAVIVVRMRRRRRGQGVVLAHPT